MKPEKLNCSIHGGHLKDAVAHGKKNKIKAMLKDKRA